MVTVILMMWSLTNGWQPLQVIDVRNGVDKLVVCHEAIVILNTHPLLKQTQFKCEKYRDA